jgi:hypothetical protein
MPAGSLFENATHKSSAWGPASAHNAITTLTLFVSRTPFQPSKTSEWHVTKCSALMQEEGA